MTAFSSRLAQTQENIRFAQIWKSRRTRANVFDCLACGGGLFPYCKRWALPARYTQKADTSRFQRQTDRHTTDTGPRLCSPTAPQKDPLAFFMMVNESCANKTQDFTAGLIYFNYFLP